MRRPTASLVCVLFLCLQGCASALYRGEILAPDSAGEERRVVLYWSRTRAFPWQAKAGPALLLTQCGTPVTFVERPEGLVFLGTPGQDEPVGGTATGSEFLCGRLLGGTRFVDLEEGPLEVKIICKPVVDDEGFGAVPAASGYLAANSEPYRFVVAAERSWSLFGATPPAPAPPECPNP